MLLVHIYYEKRDAEVDWTVTATDAARRVRAYNPFPGAYFFAGEQRIKLWRATPVDGTARPGTVLQADRDAIVVACGRDALRLDELQLPGKRRVPATEFAGQFDLAAEPPD